MSGFCQKNVRRLSKYKNAPDLKNLLHVDEGVGYI